LFPHQSLQTASMATYSRFSVLDTETEEEIPTFSDHLGASTSSPFDDDDLLVDEIEPPPRLLYIEAPLSPSAPSQILEPSSHPSSLSDPPARPLLTLPPLPTHPPLPSLVRPPHRARRRGTFSSFSYLRSFPLCERALSRRSQSSGDHRPDRGLRSSSL
ncbi:Unknown protein, partial [Striga hermonthica]